VTRLDVLGSHRPAAVTAEVPHRLKLCVDGVALSLLFS
jgi:hypothetical protein